MKTAFFTILMIQFLKINSQVEVLNLSLTDSTKKVIYIGIDNEIEIKGFKGNKTISIKANKCDVSKPLYFDKINRFILRGKKTGLDTLLIIEDSIYLSNFIYEIKRVNNIEAILSEKKSTTLTKEEILLNPYLTLTIPDCYLKQNTYVTSFELYYKSSGKYTVPLYENKNSNEKDTIVEIDYETGKEYLNFTEVKYAEDQNTGNYLSDFQKKQITKMKKGDMLMFERIKIMAPCPRIIDGLKITLK
jgi:hypothetical protein